MDIHACFAAHRSVWQFAVPVTNAVDIVIFITMSPLVHKDYAVKEQQCS